MSFINALRKDGYELVRPFVGDTGGRWERLLFNGEKRSSGRYTYIEEGGRALAVYGSDKDARGFMVWRSWEGEKISEFDYKANQKWMEKKRAEIEARMRARQDRLAKRLTKVYNNMPDARVEHGYIKGKGVGSAERAKYRRKGGLLIVPMVDGATGLVVGFQKVTESGKKWAVRGSRLSGSFCPLKSPSDDCEIVYVCEGYATGLTIREVTGAAVFVAFNAGNLLAVSKWVREKYSDAVIVVAGDNDCWGSGENVGEAKARSAAGAIGGFSLIPDKGLLDEGETDWNDVYVRHGRDVVYNGLTVRSAAKQEQSAPIPSPQPSGGAAVPAEWRDQMKWKDDAPGGILDHRHSLWNAMLYLPNDERWAGTFVYDEFDQTEKVVRALPWDDEATFEVREVTDVDLTHLRAQMGLAGIRINTNTEMNNVVSAVARKGKIHPVREWFDNLEWDGQPRLDTWAVRYLGAIEQPQDFVEAVSRCWLIAAVKRIYEPGAPFHHMLVLEGGQGVGKSTFLESIATFGGKAYFSDALTFSHIKKTQEAANLMRGCIVVEFGEMVGKSNTDNEHIKQWITQTHDEYTPKFSNKPFKQPRQCVFAASTNMDMYLDDPSGGRRFWPIKVGSVDLVGFEEVKEQIWAEAVHRYKQGELWYINKDDPVYDLMEKQQTERGEDNVWADMIGEWVMDQARPDGYMISEILEKACLVPRERLNERKYIKQASEAMRVLGFDNRVRWVNGKAQRRWARGDD